MVTFFDCGTLCESLLGRFDEVFHCLLLTDHASDIAGVHAENFSGMTGLTVWLDGRLRVLRLAR